MSVSAHILELVMVARRPPGIRRRYTLLHLPLTTVGSRVLSGERSCERP
jgi:hypothetical protein